MLINMWPLPLHFYTVVIMILFLTHSDDLSSQAQKSRIRWMKENHLREAYELIYQRPTALLSHYSCGLFHLNVLQNRLASSYNRSSNGKPRLVRKHKALWDTVNKKKRTRMWSQVERDWSGTICCECTGEDNMPAQTTPLLVAKLVRH